MTDTSLDEAPTAETLVALGRRLLDGGQFEHADIAFRLALSLEPRLFEAHMGLGTALEQLGDHAAAEQSFRTAIRIRPDYAAAHNNLAIALYGCGQLDDCIVAYKAALALRPDLAAIHHNLGEVLRDVGRTAEAVAAFEAAVALAPDDSESAVQLAHARRLLCDWEHHEADWERLRSVLARGAPMPPFTLLAWPSTPGDQLAAAHNWQQSFNIPPETRLASEAHKAAGKIRLGYVSCDFRSHALGQLISEVVERHDRRRFEVVCYSFGADDGSAARARIKAAADAFIDIDSLSYVEAARRIADDGVDILVDLQGHTKGARSQIFACRPAPIQVNYLGYPGTMGMACIDYVVGDQVVAPSADQCWFAEKIVQLPGSYQANDTTRAVDAPLHSREDYGLPAAGFVFCCFNNSFKITPAVFDVWMRLLAGVPGSALWLLDTSPDATRNLRREAARLGIAPERLVFAPKVGPEEHLARHRYANLFVDTFPYGAHTTGSDALWAGLPVVTMTGRTFASRVAAGLLKAADLGELVATSFSDYEALALRLARSPAKLSELRARLIRTRSEVPLFDMGQFMSGLEIAYTEMNRRHLAGEAPGAFAVSGPRLELMSAA